MSKGLRCSMNSDDPAMFATSLTNEYQTLARQGFTWDELWALNRATLDATFLDESERKELARHWEVFENSQSPETKGNVSYGRALHDELSGC